VNRQETSAIFEVVHEGTAGCGLKPRAVVEGSVVVADGRVITPGADFEVRVGFVGYLETLDVQAPEVGGIGSDYDFADTADVFGKTGRKKEIKLADLERVMNWLGQRKDQGIGVRT